MTRPTHSGTNDDPIARETLIRLANSCERAAARVAATISNASDLDEEDFRTIAAVLRRLAGK
jgi:hypothetical protein